MSGKMMGEEHSLSLPECNPGAGDIVVSAGAGHIWKYGASGISNLYVEGGLKFHEAGRFSFADLRRLHNLIADELLGRELLTGEMHRFLRKELLLTIEDVAAASGAEVDEVADWETDTARFVVTKAMEYTRASYIDYRESGSLPTVHSQATIAVA